jgi:hypothetical protein
METPICAICKRSDWELRACVRCRRLVCNADAMCWFAWKYGPPDNPMRMTEATCQPCWDADMAIILEHVEAYGDVDLLPSFEELGCWGNDPA